MCDTPTDRKKTVFPAELFLQCLPYPRTSPPDGGNTCKRIAYELFTRTSYVFWIFFGSVYFPLLFFGKGVFFLFFFLPFPSVPETGISACCQRHAARGNFSFVAVALWAVEIELENARKIRNSRRDFAPQIVRWTDFGTLKESQQPNLT